MASQSRTISKDTGKGWITDRLLPTTTITELREWLLPLMSLVVVLTIWQLVCTFLSVPEFVLPSPARIIAEISVEFRQLFKHTAITLGEAGAGFILANMLSLIFALIFCYSPFFEKSGYPYMIAFQSIPLVALAPLINLWFGEGVISKVVMAGLITFFPMVVNATHGLKAVPPLSLDVMKSLSATELQILRKLRIPTALPYILSALRISAPLAVVGAIVAELTAASSGIGYLILVAAYRVQTPFLFACIVFASIGGIIFFGLSVMIGQILTRRRKEDILPAERLMAHIRSGLEISEYTAMSINRFGGYEKLRAEIRWPDDAPYIKRLVDSSSEKVRFVGYALHHKPIRQGDTNALAVLQQAWRKADTLNDKEQFQERMQLMWQMLDAEKLEDKWHREIYSFVADNWLLWCDKTLNWTAQGDRKAILLRVKRRLADKEYPETKSWAYLLQTTISKDIKGMREIATPYINHSHFLVRRIAVALMDASEQDIQTGCFPGPSPSLL